ncbi:MAG: D-alanyl-D-alanine carboxypeptidase/D-alanyl-D-alanine endopeptidase [Terriglobales bacterium]
MRLRSWPSDQAFALRTSFAIGSRRPENAAVSGVSPCPPGTPAGGDKRGRWRWLGAAAPLAVVLAASSLWAVLPPRRRPRLPNWKTAARKLLETPTQRRARWGVYAYSLTHHKVVFDFHGDALLTPASNTKLFTLAAAMQLIGPDYRFHTPVQSTALPDAQGVVSGDLVLVGKGDPDLSGRILPYRYPESDKSALLAQNPDKPIQELADQIKARGVTVVTGNIIGDDSYFSRTRYAPGWAQDDLLWGYGAAISALCVNDNSILLHVLPGATVGAPAQITLAPWAAIYTVSNYIRTGPPDSQPNINIVRPVDSNHLTLWGSIALNGKDDWESLGVQKPALFAARLLKQALQARGIAVYGRAEARHAPLRMGDETQIQTYPPAPYTLATYTSLPLQDDMQLLAKISQNQWAEMLLRLLGRLQLNDGSLAAGLQVRAAFLHQQVGLDPHAFDLYDGSGLARDNLVQPEAVVQLLTYMDQQPRTADFRALLPIAAVDGDLHDRFRGTPSAGRILAKTGYVDHVYALSGYAITLGGDHLAFSIIVNDDDMKGKEIKQVMDEIANAMVTGVLTPMPLGG